MGPRPRGSTARRGTGTPNRARAVCRPGSAAHPRARTSQRPPAGDCFAIKELANQLPCHGKIDCVRLDPAAAARTSLGPAAYAEYEQVFGSRLVARWPRHLVLDGLEMLALLLESGNLLIHPRCSRLRDAFQSYARQRRGGEWIDYPADGHPEEDMIDALRGGVRDAFPAGLVSPPNLRPVHAGRVLG